MIVALQGAAFDREDGDEEYPDIGEMVAAVTMAEAALAEGQKMLCGNDFTDDRSLFQDTPFFEPLKACRAVLSQITKVQEAA